MPSFRPDQARQHAAILQGRGVADIPGVDLMVGIENGREQGIGRTGRQRTRSGSTSCPIPATRWQAAQMRANAFLPCSGSPCRFLTDRKRFQHSLAGADQFRAEDRRGSLTISGSAS